MLLTVASIMQQFLRGLIIVCVLAGLGIGLSACSGSPGPSKGHDSGPPAPEAIPDPFVLNPKIVPDQSIVEYQAKEELSAQSVDTIYQTRILPLQEAAINLDMLTNPRIRGSQLTELIRLYNSAVLDLCKIEPKGMRCRGLLIDYEAMLKHGCDSRMRGCALISTFRETQSSVKVWKLVSALATDSPMETYNRVLLGLGIGKGQRDRYFPLKLLEISPAIEKMYDERDRSQLSRSDREAEDVHFTNVERVIKQRKALSHEETYRDYIRYIIRQPVSAVVTGKEKVKRTAIRVLGESGVIEEKWFQDAVTASFDDNENSYTQAYKEIDAVTDRVLNIYNLETKLSKNANYHLVNNLYLMVWDMDAVRDMWKGSKQDRENLKQVMKHYVQIQFLRLVARSHERMGKFYRDRNYSQNNMHNLAMDVSHEIRSQWISFYDRVGRIRDFAFLAFENDIDEIKVLKFDPENLNKTVQLYVSTPHMFMLAYRMVKDKFVVRTFFGSVDGNMFFNYIFTNGIASWFDYRPSAYYLMHINQATLLLGLHFALRTEAFSFFDVEPGEFFAFVSKQLMNGDIEAARDRLLYYTKPEHVYKSQYEDLMKVCAEEKRIEEWELTPEETFAKPRHRNYSVTVTPEDFRWSTLLYGFGKIFFDFSGYNQNAKVRALEQYFRYNSNTHQQHINMVRLSLQNKTNMIKNFRNIYSDFLTNDLKLGKDSEVVQRLMAPIEKEIDRAKHFQRRFYTKVKSIVDNLFKECATLLIRRELDTQNALYVTMAEYYKQLYRDYQEIKRLREQIKDPGEGTAEIEKYKAAIARLEAKQRVSHPDLADFDGLDHFDYEKEQFITYRLDTIIRYSDFLREGYKSETFSTGAINNGVRLIMPVAGFRELGRFTTNGFRLDFKKAKDADDFAKRSMRLHRGFTFGDDKFLVFWNKGHTWWAQFFLQDQMDMYLNLYKAGHFEAYSEDAPECMFETFREGCEKKIEITQMDPDLIARDTFRMYELMTASETDREVLDLLGMADRGQEATYIDPNFLTGEIKRKIYGSVAGYLYDPRNRDPQGFFDYHMMVVNMEDLGWNISYNLPWNTSYEGYAAPPYMPLLRARAFMFEFQDEQLLMMPPSSSVKVAMKAELIETINGEFDRIFEFYEYVKDLEAREKAEGIERVFDVATNEADIVDGPYVSPKMLSQSQDRYTGFHRDTRYMFAPELKEGGADGEE